jgi:hypothetical protein
LNGITIDREIARLILRLGRVIEEEELH